MKGLLTHRRTRNLNAKRAKRTVLEDMIFNGKIPPAVLTARENDERMDNLKG